MGATRLRCILALFLAGLFLSQSACTATPPGEENPAEMPLQPWRVLQAAPDTRGRFVQLARPVAVAGWQDQIFIADAGRGVIYRYDRSADRLTPFHVRALSPDVRLLTNAAGELYVTDPDQRQVLRLDGQGRVIQRFRDFNLNRPVALYDDPRGGRLLVLDGPYQQVLAFNRLGRLEEIIHPRDEYGQPPGGLIDLVADGTRFYLLDGARREVLVVDRQGRFVSRFGAARLRQPVALARDFDGRLLVADAFDNRLWIFPARRPAGTRARAVMLNASRIRDLAVQAGWLFVADEGMGAVHILRLAPPVAEEAPP